MPKGILSILVVTLLGSIGCELDFPNPNAPIVENVTIQSLVTGAEAGMRVDYAIYLRAVASVGREAYYFEPADPRYTGELLRATPDPGGFLLNRPWAARYRTIANCRFLLDKAQSLSATERAGVEGFAKTIMAYQLLLNLNYLDDNGIKLDFSGELGVPFSTKPQAYAFIENLLDEANTSLGSPGTSFPFTLSGGFEGFRTPSEFATFNRALKARVAIYQGKFDDALTALTGSFVNTAASMTLGAYHVYGTGLGDQDNEIFESPTAPFVKLMVHPSFEASAETGDSRFSSKATLRLKPPPGTGPDTTTFDNLISRLAVSVTTIYTPLLPPSSTTRLPIIRNEELLLIRAEANIGLNNLGPAQDDINTVRAAAGLGNVTLTAGNAVDQLLHERHYSLFMEGHRWVDMRRHSMLNLLPLDRTGDVVLVRMPRPETEVSG